MAAKSSFAFRNNGEKGYNSGFYEAIGKKNPNRIKHIWRGKKREKKTNQTLETIDICVLLVLDRCHFHKPFKFSNTIERMVSIDYRNALFCLSIHRISYAVDAFLVFFSSLSRQPFSNLFLFTFIFFYGGKKNTPLTGSYVC